MISDLSMLHDETYAATRWMYGIYAELPGKPLCFLGPVFAYRELRSLGNPLESGRKDIRELLDEFGDEYPDLCISLRMTATREVLSSWTKPHLDRYPGRGRKKIEHASSHNVRRGRPLGSGSPLKPLDLSGPLELIEIVPLGRR